MSREKALVRELVERIEGVNRTWFELNFEGENRTRTLVAEVSFDLDANSADFSRATCDEIEEAVATVLREENSDIVSKLKIVTGASAASAGQGGKSTKSAPANKVTLGPTDGVL